MKRKCFESNNITATWRTFFIVSFYFGYEFLPKEWVLRLIIFMSSDINYYFIEFAVLSGFQLFNFWGEMHHILYYFSISALTCFWQCLLPSIFVDFSFFLLLSFLIFIFLFLIFLMIKVLRLIVFVIVTVVAIFAFSYHDYHE